MVENFDEGGSPIDAEVLKSERWKLDTLSGPSALEFWSLHMNEEVNEIMNYNKL